MEELYGKGGSSPLRFFTVRSAESPLARIGQECRGGSRVVTAVERGLLYRTFRLRVFRLPQEYIPFGGTETGIGKGENPAVRRRDGFRR